MFHRVKKLRFNASTRVEDAVDSSDLIRLPNAKPQKEETINQAMIDPRFLALSGVGRKLTNGVASRAGIQVLGCSPLDALPPVLRREALPQ